ncbi:MAG: hypothetical protein FD123_2241 [Bacteroidetes bacterium]|nr:MAG: hypothetical protein FD123_2241 [Bacteroidota bacterium]
MKSSEETTTKTRRTQGNTETPWYIFILKRFPVRVTWLFSALPVFFFLLTSCTGETEKPPVNDTSTAGPAPDQCATILKKTLRPDATDSSMSIDFGQMLACHYLDSFDLNYIVPNLIPEIMADQLGDTTVQVTYQAIFDKVQVFHHTERYVVFRKQMLVLDSMRAVPVDPKHWEKDTALLASLGMEKRELLHLQKVVRELASRKNVIRWSEALDSTDQQLRRQPIEPGT